MATRETMAALIRRLRRLIGDPASENQTWQDEDLQDALDGHRREARYMPLCPQPTYSGSSVSYLVYKAEIGDWEGSADSTTPVLTNANFGTISTDDYEEDLLTGRWTFTAQPTFPVYVTGFHYDLNGAAVEILEAWIASLKCAVDVSADGISVKNSQKVDHLEMLADRYRRQQWAGSGCYSVTDVTPAHSGHGGYPL